jgi:hypothetical protein
MRTTLVYVYLNALDHVLLLQNIEGRWKGTCDSHRVLAFVVQTDRSWSF